MSHQILAQAIHKYAAAYRKLQRLQDRLPWIPGGDQKTGSIGEYYAFVYLMSVYGEDKLSFGGHCEKGWDIKIDSQPSCLIQVKTVSAFSKTRTMSPIHKGWQELFIIYLSQELVPEGFWIVKDTSFFGTKNRVDGVKCQLPGNPRTGSKLIHFGENLVKEMQGALANLV